MSGSADLHASEAYSELTPAEQRVVKSGAQVVKTRNIKGQVWPELTVYQVVDASPDEVMGVFFDYNHARHFIPNVIKSEISSVITSCILDVDYAVKIPVFADEHYTARNTLTAVEGGGYAVTWKLLKALQTKNSIGEFRVEPFHEKSLVRYRNLTTPGSAVARLLKNPAIKQMRQSATAVMQEVVRQKKSDPTSLEQRVKALHSALGQVP